jgi:hypothetical protein
MSNAVHNIEVMVISFADEILVVDQMVADGELMIFYSNKTTGIIDDLVQFLRKTVLCWILCWCFDGVFLID